MCVDRDHRPALLRRRRRAARRWWRSWRWTTLDGPGRRWRSPAVHALGAAGDAGSPPADGGSPSADGNPSSTDADGAAQHAHGAARHAEHAATSCRNAGGRHGRHGPAPGAKLSAAERGFDATAESCAALVAQRHGTASTRVSVAHHRIATGARFNPSIRSCSHSWPGRASWRRRSPRGGRWYWSDETFAGSNAGPTGFWRWPRFRPRSRAGHGE